VQGRRVTFDALQSLPDAYRAHINVEVCSSINVIK
jgi:hypothetical protein